jgi:hypothetical protein
MDETVAELLRAFLREPDRRPELGQRAALLWWELDDARRLAGEAAPWEEALLGLAAWHTADDRLRRQRLTEAEAEELLRRLGRGG